jgi:hypothetical protein
MKDVDQANRLKKFLSNVSGDFWMGLTDVQTEGVYVWTLSQTIATWMNWKPGEPSGNATENCFITTKSTQWSDAPCSWVYGNPLCSYCK